MLELYIIQGQEMNQDILIKVNQVRNVALVTLINRRCQGYTYSLGPDQSPERARIQGQYIILKLDLGHLQGQEMNREIDIKMARVRTFTRLTIEHTQVNISMRLHREVSFMCQNINIIITIMHSLEVGPLISLGLALLSLVCIFRISYCYHFSCPFVTYKLQYTQTIHSRTFVQYPIHKPNQIPTDGNMCI